MFCFHREGMRNFLAFQQLNFIQESYTSLGGVQQNFKAWIFASRLIIVVMANLQVSVWIFFGQEMMSWKTKMTVSKSSGE